MKTKTFNHFRNLFAFVGFFIIACSAAVELDSADDNPDDIPPIVQNNNGKYQATLSRGDSATLMTVLNTESGSSKTYYWRLSSGTYSWQDVNSVKFTH